MGVALMVVKLWGIDVQLNQYDNDFFGCSMVNLERD